MLNDTEYTNGNEYENNGEGLGEGASSDGDIDYAGKQNASDGNTGDTTQYTDNSDSENADGGESTNPDTYSEYDSEHVYASDGTEKARGMGMNEPSGDNTSQYDDDDPRSQFSDSQ